MVKELKVLVLGNDPQINEIDFSRLPKSVVTLGVNRIWLKHIPNYFFFHDFDILKELHRYPEETKALMTYSKPFSSDWLNFSRPSSASIPSWIKLYPRPNKNRFPDSITTAMSIFKAHLMKGVKVTYYVAGVSLKWSEPSHFWKELDYFSLNRHNEKWYEPRFDMVLENFKKLNFPRGSIVSVHPESMLNKYYRYEGIENLYLN